MGHHDGGWLGHHQTVRCAGKASSVSNQGSNASSTPGIGGPEFALLLDRARALENAALGELYSRYLPVVYRTVLARVGDVHLAEDLTADTFMVMVDSIERVRTQDELGFVAWLLGIARHKISEHFRRQAARPSLRIELTSHDEPQTYGEEDDPLGVVLARERWAEVTTALARLTEEQRTVLLYRCVLGYATPEVARMMGREPGAIRALQFRALAALARALATNGTNPAVAAIRAIAALPQPAHARGRISRPKATAKE